MTLAFQGTVGGRHRLVDAMEKSTGRGMYVEDFTVGLCAPTTLMRTLMEWIFPRRRNWTVSSLDWHRANLEQARVSVFFPSRKTKARSLLLVHSIREASWLPSPARTK